MIAILTRPPTYLRYPRVRPDLVKGERSSITIDVLNRKLNCGKRQTKMFRPFRCYVSDFTRVVF